jgi:hypothetical protein
MSANKSIKDQHFYFPYQNMTALEQQQLFTQFEMNCDFDVADIKQEAQEKKFLKRVCVYKLIVAPVELPITFLLFGKTELGYKYKITNLYWRFLRNKLTLEKFGKEVTHLLKSGKVL